MPVCSLPHDLASSKTQWNFKIHIPLFILTLWSQMRVKTAIQQHDMVVLIIQSWLLITYEIYIPQLCIVVKRSLLVMWDRPWDRQWCIENNILLKYKFTDTTKCILQNEHTILENFVVVLTVWVIGSGRLLLGGGWANWEGAWSFLHPKKGVNFFPQSTRGGLKFFWAKKAPFCYQFVKFSPQQKSTCISLYTCIQFFFQKIL